MSFVRIVTAILLFACAAQVGAQGVSSMDQSAASSRVFALGLEPHWLLVGGIGAKMDLRLSDRVALSLGGMTVPSRSNVQTSDKNTISDTETYKWSMYEVYFGPTIYLTGTFNESGVYLNPAIGYTGAAIKDYSSPKLSGSIDAAEARVTGGYQWVLGSGLRFLVGAGFRAAQSSDVIVKDNAGKEVLREKSGLMSGLALDGQIAWMF